MNLLNLEQFKNKKNLLAFSGGTDSSALFHLLLKNNITFDIAIVNYNTRDTSVAEMEYALQLVKVYNESQPFDKMICFTHSVDFKPSSNFEMEARNIRYDFFHSLIDEYHYDNLITGHNLNDKMEWFLMQMTKGAGIKELFGMEPVTKKEKYTIVRPLIATSKDEILEYLEKNQIKYFFDESNKDEKYKRNYFRNNYVESLISEFKDGIQRTFNILEDEVKQFQFDINYIEKSYNYCIVEANEQNFVYLADSVMKHYGYVMSYHQRQTLKELKEVMIDRKNVLSFANNKLFFTPYIQDIVMTKEFKNKMREEKIPVKNRPFFFVKEKNSFRGFRKLEGVELKESKTVLRNSIYPFSRKKLVAEL